MLKVLAQKKIKLFELEEMEQKKHKLKTFYR